jgi:tetratricopeptide (TPR) repeat protein
MPDIDLSLQNNAIQAALSQNWKEAITLNTALLKQSKDDIGALCRLAYAHLKSGQVKEAKKIYEKVLSIDQYNKIAEKNLKKLATIKKKDVVDAAGSAAISPMMFLEEPGITKIVDCIHIAPPQALSTLSAGEEVLLKSKNHCIEIRTNQNTYLGALPDDISFRLLKLMESGNTYRAIIKSVEKNTLQVLIRETARGKRFANQPTFAASTSYVPFARGMSSADAPDMTPTGEDDADGDSSNEE